MSIFANFNAPGVRINETTQGYTTLNIASFETIYMVGSSTQGAFFTPTQVTSLADFTNQFEYLSSANSVKLLFRNDQRGVVYFVRTQPALGIQVTVNSVVAGDYPIAIACTMGSATATYTAITGNTTAQVATGLINAINSSTIASYITAYAGPTSNTLTIYADSPSYPFLAVTSTNTNVSFVNARSTANDSRQVTITSAIPNRTYSLNFHNSNTIVSYNSGSNPTIQSIRDGLVAAINTTTAINTSLIAVADGTVGSFHVNNLTLTVPLQLFVQSSGDAMSVINPTFRTLTVTKGFLRRIVLDKKSKIRRFGL